ncbi:MAG: hypothetical protein IJS90_09165 [Clostridia bacterium]|nr:hypothetical protein [Clostridia bacterium]
MKKKVLIIIPVVLIVAAAVLAALTFGGNRSFSEGVIFISANGTKYFIDENNCPISMSEQNGIVKKQIEKLYDGQGVLLLHDGIEESYPAKTGAYFIIDLRKTVDKLYSDEMLNILNGVPVDDDNASADGENLTPTGYDPENDPVLTSSTNMVSSPVYGIGTNKEATISIDARFYTDSFYTSMFLHDFLGNLDYSEELLNGQPELTVTLSDGVDYYVNLTEGWVETPTASEVFKREKPGRCKLTELQITTLENTIEWLKNRSE